MKAKFKETLERCDNLEQRLGEITKEKQGFEKRWVFSGNVFDLKFFGPIIIIKVFRSHVTNLWPNQLQAQR